MIKIEFESKSLDRAIGLLKDINSNLKWNPIPVLNGVRIHTDSKDTIRLYVTNLEVSAEVEVVGKVIEEGEVVVDKRPFIDFLKMNSKISVHLLEGDQVEITGDGARNIRLSNIQDDYPSVTPEKEGEVIAKCSVEILSDMLGKTIFAADKDEGYLGGHPFQNICLHFLADGNVRSVATDGKILAMVTEYRIERLSHDDSGDWNDKKLLTPRKSAEILMRTLKRLRQATVTMIFYPDEKNPENNRILFEVNGIRILFKLADMEYPDYEQIIPQNKDRLEFAVNTSELLKALKNISILAPKSRRVTLQVEVDKIRISTEGDLGAAQEVVAIKRDSLLRNESDPSVTAFNVDCLTNILNHMEAKTALISLDGSNAEAGALIKPADSSRYLYLLMPMKLQ